MGFYDEWSVDDLSLQFYSFKINENTTIKIWRVLNEQRLDQKEFRSKERSKVVGDTRISNKNERKNEDWKLRLSF